MRSTAAANNIKRSNIYMAGVPEEEKACGTRC